MSKKEYARFDSSTNTRLSGARVVRVERRLAGESPLVEITVVRSSRSERYKDLFIVASYRANDKRLGYQLDRVKQGDRVTVEGPLHYTTYLPKSVDIKSLKTAEKVLEAVRMKGEMPFASDLVVHEDLRGRDKAGEESGDEDGGTESGEVDTDSLGGGKAPEATETFFGDE